MDDAFKFLGLPDTATCAQVRTAYRKKAEKLHPDKGGDAQAFIQLNGVYRDAMIRCTKPIECADCGGTGFTERVSGWRVARIICAVCGGRGTIERGGGL